MKHKLWTKSFSRMPWFFFFFFLMRSCCVCVVRRPQFWPCLYAAACVCMNLEGSSERVQQGTRRETHCHSVIPPLFLRRCLICLHLYSGKHRVNNHEMKNYARRTTAGREESLESQRFSTPHRHPATRMNEEGGCSPFCIICRILLAPAHIVFFDVRAHTHTQKSRGWRMLLLRETVTVIYFFLFAYYSRILPKRDAFLCCCFIFA